MKIVTKAVVLFALACSITGCTFRPFLRESRDATLSATPPCYSGDICPVSFGGFEWTTDVMHSAR